MSEIENKDGPGKSENLDKVISNLCNWFKDNDYDIEFNSPLKLIVSENPNEGRCVIASRNIKSNQNLLEFKLKFLINYRFALKEPELLNFFKWSNENYKKSIKKNAETTIYRLSRLDALYIYLISQKLNQESSLHKFINSIPVSYDTPEYFDTEIIECLPQHLKIDVVKRLDKLKSKFKFISDSLNEYSNGLDLNENKTIDLLAKNFNFELFKWIFCSVNSRCFHSKEKELLDQEEIELANKIFGKLHNKSELKSCDNLGDYEKQFEYNEEIRNNLCCLIPYLDFLNHSFSPNTYAYFDVENKCYQLKSQKVEAESEDDFSAFDENKEEKVVDDYIKENQQVYITYGYHDNRTLLVEYGFILEDNVYDKIVFNTKDIGDLVENPDHLDYLWRKSIHDKFLTDLSCNSSEGPSWYLLKMLNLINYLNELKNSKNKKKTSESSSQSLNSSFEANEILNPMPIKKLYLNLLGKYENYLNTSLNSLKELETKTSINLNQVHKNMISKFVNLQLNIIKVNIELANDPERWDSIF